MRFEEIRGAGDFAVYHDIGTRAGEVFMGSRGDVESEYPPMVTGIFWITNTTIPEQGDFATAWVILVCIVTVFCWGFLRYFGAHDAALASVALFLTTRFLGPQLVFGRYDILMTLALFLSWRSHVHGSYAQSAAWLAMATALKVVPILAFPLLFVATPRKRWPSLLIGAFSVGFITFFLSAAILGIHGTVSNITYMLSYHANRPVQAESLWSGLSFLFSSFLSQKDPTGFSHMSFVNNGIGIFPVFAAKFLVGVGMLFLILRGLDSRTERGFGISLILLMTWSVAVSTVLSPQYMLWIIPLLIAFLSERIIQGTADKRIFLLFFLAIATAGLTQWIYPLHYNEVINQERMGIFMLNLRNSLLFIIVYFLLIEAGYLTHRRSSTISSVYGTSLLRQSAVPR